VKVQEIVQPTITPDEVDLIQRAEQLHDDPNLPINPKLQAQVHRLVKLGFLRQLRGDNLRYEPTEKGKAVAR